MIDYSQSALPKPTRKRLVNHSRKKKTVKRRKMVLVLDGDARQQCFERDGQKCVRCGVPGRAIQWAHIFSRRHLCLRWHPANALTLCGGCHLWWHQYPLLAADWFRKNWPERYEWIIQVFNSGEKVDVKALYEARG